MSDSNLEFGHSVAQTVSIHKIAVGDNERAKFDFVQPTWLPVVGGKLLRLEARVRAKVPRHQSSLESEYSWTFNFTQQDIQCLKCRRRQSVKGEKRRTKRHKMSLTGPEPASDFDQKGNGRIGES